MTNEQIVAQFLARGGKVLASFGGGEPRTSSAPPPSPTRPEDRYKSQTERRFVADILEPWRQDGHITGWAYEPMKGLYLAPQTSYTPDFLTWNLWRRDERLRVYEVKGAFIRGKDFQKLKQAAALYPCFDFFVAQFKENAWHFADIPPI